MSSISTLLYIYSTFFLSVLNETCDDRFKYLCEDRFLEV